jgi:Fur family transcriptional regulator, ferric uptake regulator
MKPIEILSSNNLKRTSCREGIIKAILSGSGAMSEDEIREQLEGNYDRTTFYRSFKTLREKGILHKIVVDNQLVKYALDSNTTGKSYHPHFFCFKCQKVSCMGSIQIPEFSLPKGFIASEVELIIKGKCAICAVEN